MCIIIQGKTKDFTKKILSRAYSNNADGFGLMYLKNNKIVAQLFVVVVIVSNSMSPWIVD